MPNLIAWQGLSETSIKMVYQDLSEKNAEFDWLSDREHDSRKVVYLLNLNNTVFSTKVIFSIKPPWDREGGREMQEKRKEKKTKVD